MVEKPQLDELEETEEQFLPVLVQPDEARWWELQLGVRLPPVSSCAHARLSSKWATHTRASNQPSKRAISPN